MKRTLTAFAIAAFAAIIPAQAAVISVNFSGKVTTTQGTTGYASGSTVSGHFDLNTTTGNFVDFTVGGMSVMPGFASSALYSIGGFDSIYTAQISPVSAGGTSNDTFSLDLSSLTNWPAGDTPYTLLTDTNQLTTNLDTITNPLSAFPSTFTYYIANANGTGITALTADLTSLTATTPEPATIALLGFSLLGLGVVARRRRA